MQRKFSYEEKVEAIRLSTEEKMSLGRIAERYNTSKSVVEKWVSTHKYNGLDGLKDKPSNIVHNEAFKKEILYKVLEEKKSYNLIAAIYNMSSSTIRRWCVKYKNEDFMGEKTLTPKESAVIRKKRKNITEEDAQKLQERNEYLEMENAVLKKSSALVLEQLKIKLR